MIADLVQQIAEAAVIEASTVPKLLEREGELYWRAPEGRMVQLTDALIATPVDLLEDR